MGQLIQHLTEWSGFDNYQEILGSADFWRVTLRTLVFTAVNVVLIMVLGMLSGCCSPGSARRCALTAARRRWCWPGRCR